MSGSPKGYPIPNTRHSGVLAFDDCSNA